MLDDLIEYDKELLIFLNNLGELHYDTFWIYITSFVYWIPLLFFVFYKIYRKFTRIQARYLIAYSLFILFVSLFCVEFVKILVERLRPCNDPTVAPFLTIVIQPTNYSFFSGHATVSFALTTFLFLMLRKSFYFIRYLFIWPIFFLYSRLYFGVHYPSDILVGILVGVLIGIIFYRNCNARIVKLRIY